MLTLFDFCWQQQGVALKSSLFLDNHQNALESLNRTLSSIQLTSFSHLVTKHKDQFMPSLHNLFSSNFKVRTVKLCWKADMLNITPHPTLRSGSGGWVGEGWRQSPLFYSSYPLQPLTEMAQLLDLLYQTFKPANLFQIYKS